MKASKKVSLRRVILLVTTVILAFMLICTLPYLFTLGFTAAVIFVISVVTVAAYRAIKVPNMSDKEYTQYITAAAKRMEELLASK